MLTVALPKGRLQKPVLERFAAAGIAPDEEPGTSRKLIIGAGAAARFVSLKDADVPLYVERGAADLGVCGLDQVLESGADLLTPVDFGFGKCRLCLAAPRGSSRSLSPRKSGRRSYRGATVRASARLAGSRLTIFCKLRSPLANVSGGGAKPAILDSLRKSIT